MKTTINDFIQFISSYREMETSNKSTNKRFIKAVVPQRKFDHLHNSWSGRNNDFGSFFLNLEYKIQGLFLREWGITLTSFHEFLEELDSSPHAYFTATPPIEILEMHNLMLFFNNHAIEKSGLPSFSFITSPINKYGNSANWGNYILSLPIEEKVEFFNCFESYCQTEIERTIKNINLFKETYKK